MKYVMLLWVKKSNSVCFSELKYKNITREVKKLKGGVKLKPN